MARDGKSSPFDGSGGAPSNVNAYQRANAPRPTPPGAPRNPETVAPGGPLPFQPPPSREGQMVGAGSPGKPLPVKLGG